MAIGNKRYIGYRIYRRRRVRSEGESARCITTVVGAQIFASWFVLRWMTRFVWFCFVLNLACRGVLPLYWFYVEKTLLHILCPTTAASVDLVPIIYPLAVALCLFFGNDVKFRLLQVHFYRANVNQLMTKSYSYEYTPPHNYKP